METKDNSKKAAATGVLAAIAASSCCIPPVIAAIAGVGGVGSAAGSLSWLEPFRPYLIGFAVVAIGYAWYNHYKPKAPDDCGCDIEKPKWYQTKGYLVGMTLFAFISITFPYYSGVFFPDNSKEIIIVDKSNIEKVNFKIEGMTCDACQNHINHAVNELPGILNVSSSYANGLADVEFDNSKVTIEEVESAINATGYTVVDNDKKSETKE